MTAALLGSSLAASAEPNQSETSFLVYSEKDRVKANEGLFSLTRQLNPVYSLKLHVTYDGMTGATPTGGAPSSKAQTITRPSGSVGTVVPAGQIPLDQNFRDTRFGVDAELSRPLNRLTQLNFGGHASSEHDYTSVGVIAGFTRDFNGKNSTVGLSAAYSHDISSPVGGLPVAYSPVIAPGQNQATSTMPDYGNSRSKEVYDLVVSFSQILDQRTLARIDYSLDRSHGYLTDPYKVISLVQAPDSVNAGEPVQDIYENRPLVRTKSALFGELRRYVIGTALDLSYRYFWDDWGIISHSVEASWRLDLKSAGTIVPDLRWYRQSQASFYHPFLVQGNPVPNYASADSRLAKFDALTYGLSYSVPVGTQYVLNLGIEIYSQRGDNSPPEAFGVLKTLNLFPDLDATMLRLGLSHSF